MIPEVLNTGITIGSEVRIYETYFSKRSPNDVNLNNYLEGVVISIDEFLTNYTYHFHYKVTKRVAGSFIIINPPMISGTGIADFFISKKLDAMRYVKIQSNQLKFNF